MHIVNILPQLTNLQDVIVCYTVFLVVCITESFEDQQQENYFMISDVYADYLKVDNDVDFLNHKCDKLSFHESIGEEYSCPLISSTWLSDYTNSEDIIKIEEEDEEVKCSKPGPVASTDWMHPFVSVSSPDSKCFAHTAQYLKDLKQLQFWAIQMWDASGKLASGLLSGNSNQLGDFDSCLAVEIGAIRGKYCLAYIDLEPTETAMPSLHAALLRIQAGSFVRSKHTDPGHFIPRFSTLKWGLCVPSSCKESEVEAGLKETVAVFTPFGVKSNVSVQPGMCYINEDDPTLPFATLVTLGIYGGFLMLAVVATVVDSKTHSIKLKVKDRAVRAFSLRKNINELLSKCTDDLPCIHGIRSITTFMLFTAHKLIPISSTPYNNRMMLTQYSNYALSSLLRSSSVYTDTFLQLSGVLASYNLSKEIAKQGSIKWKTRIIARFIRLTPALLAVVLYYAYVMEYLGAGPQWTSIVTANADICKTSFWKNVFYIQNFFPFEEMCASHTYQLAVDMQLYLTAPLMVYLFHQWPCRTSILLSIFLIFIAILRYYITLENNLSLYIYHSITVSDLYKTANMTYSKSLHRSTPYLMGVAVGHLLFYKQKQLHMPRVCVTVGWAICIVSALACIFYPSRMATKGAIYSATDAALYAAVSPIIWSLALSWCILACCTGYAGKVNSFLEHQWMIILSRLSYATYLTQFTVFFYYVGTLRTSQDFSLFYAIGLYEVMAVLFASLVVTLLFDLPMQDIKSLLMSQKA